MKSQDLRIVEDRIAGLSLYSVERCKVYQYDDGAPCSVWYRVSPIYHDRESAQKLYDVLLTEV